MMMNLGTLLKLLAISLIFVSHKVILYLVISNLLSLFAALSYLRISSMRRIKNVFIIRFPNLISAMIYSGNGFFLLGPNVCHEKSDGFKVDCVLGGGLDPSL